MGQRSGDRIARSRDRRETGKPQALFLSLFLQRIEDFRPVFLCYVDIGKIYNFFFREDRILDK